MTAAEERRRAVERRIGIAKGPGLIASIVFFVFTSLGVVALFGFCHELQLPKGWVTAILSIAFAEVLIRRFGFRQTGVESALWLGGLYAWIFGLPGEGKPEALLLFAVASAIAGRRVRNPIFGALAAVFVIVYLDAKDLDSTAMAAGIAIAVLALAARAREWQRPSTENLFIALMLVAPIPALVSMVFFTVIVTSSVPWAFAYLGLAVAELTFGDIKRDRVALIAGAINVAIAFVLLREFFTFAIEWKLILSGAAMFTIATFVARRLRGNARGFVMTPVKSAYEEALRVFGTAAFAPIAKPETVQQPVGSGGSFGGAGATGDF